MRKTNPDKKIESISVGLTKADIDTVNDILEHTTYLSFSEVIRQAIREFHKSERPKYIYDRSAKDRQKREEIELEKKFEEMTDLEFAQTFKPLIIYNRKDQPYAVFLALGTALNVLPVTGMKKWKDQEAFIGITEGHLKDIVDGKAPEILQRLKTGGWTTEFSNEYDIDLDAYLADK